MKLIERSDQENSKQRVSFSDRAFRSRLLLMKVSTGEPPPDFLQRAITKDIVLNKDGLQDDKAVKLATLNKGSPLSDIPPTTRTAKKQTSQ